MDPAAPLIPSKDRVSINDAELVEIIHTSRLGVQSPLGHVDFYPNPGHENQPGCGINPVCSHMRSWMYFAEALENPLALIGKACLTYDKFQKGDCKNHSELSLEFSYGSIRNNKLLGSYYLSTGDSAPFGLGQNGTVQKF